MNEAINQVEATVVILLLITAFKSAFLPNLSMRTSWPM